MYDTVKVYVSLNNKTRNRKSRWSSIRPIGGLHKNCTPCKTWIFICKKNSYCPFSFRRYGYTSHILIGLFQQIKHKSFLYCGHGNNKNTFDIPSCKLDVATKKHWLFSMPLQAMIIFLFFWKAEKTCWTKLRMHLLN